MRLGNALLLWRGEIAHIHKAFGVQEEVAEWRQAEAEFGEALYARIYQGVAGGFLEPGCEKGAWAEEGEGDRLKRAFCVVEVETWVFFPLGTGLWLLVYEDGPEGQSSRVRSNDGRTTWKRTVWPTVQSAFRLFC